MPGYVYSRRACASTLVYVMGAIVYCAHMARAKTKSRKAQAVTAQRIKNANVLSCRPSVTAVVALREEARDRGVKPSRMAAIAIEERYAPLATSDM